MSCRLILALDDGVDWCVEFGGGLQEEQLNNEEVPEGLSTLFGDELTSCLGRST